MFASLVKRTVLAAVGAFALFGLLIAVGRIDPNGSSNILASLGVSMGIFTMLVAAISIIIGLPVWWIQRMRNYPTSTLRRNAGAIAGIFIASVWLLNIIILSMVLIATITTTAQVAFVGFVFGSPAERHSHLIAITLTIMLLLGIGTVARGALGHRISWGDATRHGFQSALVCGVLVYAGLVLTVFPWGWLSGDPEYVRNNPWAIAVAIIEFIIIMTGTSTLISNQVQAWPPEKERIGQCLHGSRFSMKIKDVILRWHRIKSRLLRRRRYKDWPIFP